MNRVEGVMPSMALCFQLEEIEADTSLREVHQLTVIESAGGFWEHHSPFARCPAPSGKHQRCQPLYWSILKLAMTGYDSKMEHQWVHTTFTLQTWRSIILSHTGHTQQSHDRDVTPRICTWTPTRSDLWVPAETCWGKLSKLRCFADFEPKVSSEWILIHGLQESTDLPEPISEVRGSKDLRGSHDGHHGHHGHDGHDRFLYHSTGINGVYGLRLHTLELDNNRIEDQWPVTNPCGCCFGRLAWKWLRKSFPNKILCDVVRWRMSFLLTWDSFEIFGAKPSLSKLTLWRIPL